MNIVIFGAGAIGSLFGGLLSKMHDVVLIGRSSHVNAVRKNGLKVIGKTQLNVKIHAEELVNNVEIYPDLLILTVKAYDTESAMKQARKIIDDDTVVLSLQNGLDNIEIMKKYVDCKKVIAGVTTHGAFFSNPGIVEHTGMGGTILGELDGKKTLRIENIVNAFNQSDIVTDLSEEIIKEMWVKAVVNSSINPLTAFFQCKNGYLLENPILKSIVEEVCDESTAVANTQGLNLYGKKMFDRTVDVIKKTSENYSSMLQSLKRGKKTEIDSINGKIVEIGKIHNVDTLINETLVYLVRSMC